MNISFIIPTCGRESILHTIGSLRDQITSEDEIIVVFDQEKDASILLGRFQEMPVKIFVDKTPGDPKWGYKARTYGMTCATKPWIHIIGDDDVYLPGSIHKLRPLLEEKTPIMCKMKRRNNEKDTLWKIRHLAPCNQGGEMLVFPNIPEKFGKFSAERYDSDNIFIRQLAYNYNELRWSEIEICRWRAYAATGNPIDP
jgi:hypothetical protein